ncbi:hypothetical protein [Mesorhizobium sp. M0859]|uniref:hypothetical protein n=1 Tax=Mesorhizobium sp. M0859 TaxID=2957014 RepID=UPI00333543AC
MNELILDVESFWRFFYVGLMRRHDKKRIGFEYSWRHPEYDRERLRRILMTHTTYGYNSLSYDLPLIWYSLEEHVTPDMIKRASDGIIKGRIRWWDVEDFLGIRIPYEVKQRHIDLIEPQPNAIAGLKVLNGRTHAPQMQDLPLDPDTVPTDYEADELIAYNMGPDLDGPDRLIDALAEPLELRRALGHAYGKNFMSKSDSQIGEAIVKSRVEYLSGDRVLRADVKPGTTFRYPVPEFMKFETPQLQTILDRVRNTDFIVNAEGKVDLPKWLLDAQPVIGSSTYSMGIGGLHSIESNRAVHSTETHVLLDADVASMYPAIILMLGLYPKALGQKFLEVYKEIKEERLIAKKKAAEIKKKLKATPDDAKLKAELDVEQTRDKGLKISLNGCFGKLGSRYSVLYAPHLLLSVTLTGQLSLLMLIERAELAGIPVVSGNTDGVVFQCPRDKQAGIAANRLKPSTLAAVCDQWERDTGMDLEFNEYKAIYNQSVNSYFAIKADGGHKRKGPWAVPWNSHPDDHDPRGQLMKNPQTTICSDAALARIKDGTPVADTIRNCRDIRQFVTVIKATGGATWRGEYLGKVVRFYYGIGGDAIFKATPNASTGNFPKVPKSDGAIECMRLPDSFPDDIDYDRYIREAEEMLTDLGFYGPKIAPPKPIRVTKANRQLVFDWMSAA